MGDRRPLLEVVGPMDGAVFWTELCRDLDVIIETRTLWQAQLIQAGSISTQITPAQGELREHTLSSQKANTVAHVRPAHGGRWSWGLGRGYHTAAAGEAASETEAFVCVVIGMLRAVRKGEVAKRRNKKRDKDALGRPAWTHKKER